MERSRAFQWFVVVESAGVGTCGRMFQVWGVVLLGRLITFGNPFGLALYDKQQRQVSSSVAPTTAKSAPLALTTPDAVADMPLEPAVTTGPLERIKARASARPEAFSKGFRAAFQVPVAHPSLAGLITTSRPPALD